jgi:hypothetical protein
MRCEDCSTVYYSAAAKTMIERGERCTKCGGVLVLADGPRPVRERPKCKASAGEPPAGPTG